MKKILNQFKMYNDAEVPKQIDVGCRGVWTTVT